MGLGWIQALGLTAQCWGPCLTLLEVSGFRRLFREDVKGGMRARREWGVSDATEFRKNDD